MDKLSEFREGLKAKDIIQCEDIQKAKTRQALNAFALNMCHQAQAQKQEEEEKQTQEEQEKRKAQAQGLGNTAQGTAQSTNQAGSGVLVGTGAVAGAIAGSIALKKGKVGKKTVQKQKKSRSKSAVSKDKISASKKSKKQKPTIARAKTQTGKARKKVKAVNSHSVKARGVRTLNRTLVYILEPQMRTGPKTRGDFPGNSGNLQEI